MKCPKEHRESLAMHSLESEANHLFSTDKPLCFTRKNPTKVILGFQVNSGFGVVEELRTI